MGEMGGSLEITDSSRGRGGVQSATKNNVFLAYTARLLSFALPLHLHNRLLVILVGNGENKERLVQLGL